MFFFAELVIRELEVDVLSKIDYSLYSRYVDDTLLIIKKEDLSNVLEMFNHYDESIKFTAEVENDLCLNFLDVKVMRSDGKIHTDWYQKKVHANVTVNFQSVHPKQTKCMIVYNLIDRAIKLLHPSYHDANVSRVVNILKLNGYREKFVNYNIRRRLRKIRNEEVVEVRSNKTVEYMKVPYVKHMFSHMK